MAKELAAGDAAPDFELPTDGGGRARLADLRGKPVVLYFYPKDDTSGCTAEAIAFNGLSAQFAAAGAAVIGVSPDSASSHDKFKRKHELSSRSRPTRNDRRSTPMACGKKRACTGESISASSARPSSSTAMAGSPGSGARSRCRGTPRRFWPRRRRSKSPYLAYARRNLSQPPHSAIPRFCDPLTLMGFAWRSRSPLFAGQERGFMSLRKEESALPTSHYFLSISRGDAIRTLMVRPAALWALAALALIRSPGPPPRPSMSPFTMTLWARSSRGRRKWRRLTRTVSPKLAPGSTRSPADSCLTRIPLRAGCTNSCRGRLRSSSAAQPWPRSRPRRTRATLRRLRRERRRSSSLPTRSAPSRLSAPNRRPTEPAARRAPTRPRPASAPSRGPPSLTLSMTRPRP